MAKILLVEDDARVLAATRAALVSAGHRVLPAMNAAASLELSAAGDPADLLVVDVVLQGEDGCSLARRLQHRHPDLAVLLISGHAQETLERFGPLDERWMLLHKPYSVGQLLELVQRLLPEEPDPPEVARLPCGAPARTGKAP